MRRQILKNFIIIFFPLLLIALTLTASNLYREKSYEVESISTEAILKAENNSFLIEKYMSEIIENLNVIRDANELDYYVNIPTEANFNELNAMFNRVFNNKPDYKQIQFLNADGMEVISLVRNGEEIKSSEVVNQAERDYFKATKSLNEGEVYISEIESIASKDNSEEETTIHFATPVYNLNHEFQGVLVIDYDGSFLMTSVINQNNTKVDLPDQLYIIDADGEIIYNDDLSGLDSKFFNTSLISLTRENIAGSIEEKHILYTYYDILNHFKQSLPEYNAKLVVIHATDTSALFSLTAFFNEILKPKNVLIFLIIIGLCLAIAFALEKIRQKDDQLSITMKIAASSNDAVIITDENTVISYVNHAYEVATGYTKAEVAGKKPSAFKSGKHSQVFYQTMWEQINNTGNWEGMLWDRKKDGLLYPKKLNIIAVKGRDSGKVHHYIGIFTDLSSNKRKTDIFQTLQYSQGQLILPNEQMMMELLEQSITADNPNIMVMNIEIENYNQLISSFEGTDFNSSDIFISLIRPMIHDDDFVAQTGRNLFVVMVNLNQLEIQSEKFAQKLYNQLTRVVNISGRDLFFKTRIGISYWPEDTSDIKKLLLNSMIALDWSQKNQDAEIVFFKEEMTQKLNQENIIEGYLRQAIEAEELYLVYQPQIEIRTGDLIGMEALLRWHNKVLGEVSPAVFIPIAEKSNLIVEIGNWVIKHVCMDLKEINVICPNIEKTLRCAINFSVMQMEESGFLDNLVTILESYHIEMAQIEAEITESILLADYHKHIETLTKLRNLGVKISIDDFGTGYSSLSYLNKLPVDKIKIDRSFIKNYPQTDDGTLIEILVDMSKKLNKTVLTEGVETIDQVSYLEKIGCHYIQGYYYSKPLLLEDFIDYSKKMTVC
ncbi:EAL domain-containing protein [Eubacteriaceae bacterium ES2]|nr:EAL domain-containing protein [Eubacteriaceae bacterium ES2]